MFMFGGRLRGGMCSDELWVLQWHAHPKWEFMGPDEGEEGGADMDRARGLRATQMGIGGDALTTYERRSWPEARCVACSKRTRPRLLWPTPEYIVIATVSPNTLLSPPLQV